MSTTTEVQQPGDHVRQATNMVHADPRDLIAEARACGFADMALNEQIAATLEANLSEPVEWEYQCRLGSIGDLAHPWVYVGSEHLCSGERRRRVKAGPWLPVTPAN